MGKPREVLAAHGDVRAAKGEGETERWLSMQLVTVKSLCHRGRKCVRKCQKEGKPDSGHRTGNPIGKCHDGPHWPKDTP